MEPTIEKMKLTLTFDLSSTGLLCLPCVFELISDALNQKELEELLFQLGLANNDLSFDEQIKRVPWIRIKDELEFLGKYDLIEKIKRTTLITKGKQCFSFPLLVLKLFWYQSLVSTQHQNFIPFSQSKVIRNQSFVILH